MTADFIISFLFHFVLLSPLLLLLLLLRRSSRISTKRLIVCYALFCMFVVVFLFFANLRSERKCFYEILQTLDLNKEQIDNIQYKWHTFYKDNVNRALPILSDEDAARFVKRGLNANTCSIYKNDIGKQYYECGDIGCQHRHSIIGYLFPRTFGLSEYGEYHLIIAFDEKDKIVKIELIEYF